MQKEICRTMILTDRALILPNVNAVSEEYGVNAHLNEIKNGQAILVFRTDKVQARFHEEVKLEDLCPIGLLIEAVRDGQSFGKKKSVVLCRGLSRVELTSIERSEDGYTACGILREYINLTDNSIPAAERLIERYAGQLKKFARKPEELNEMIADKDDPIKYVNSLTPLIEGFDYNEYLQMDDVCRMCFYVAEGLKKQLDKMTLMQEIKEKVELRISANQREFLLREQKRVIEEELGNDSQSIADEANELEEYQAKLNALNLSEDAKSKVARELNTTRHMPISSLEYARRLEYFDWILRLPWRKSKECRVDLRELRAALDRDHYGIDEVKERIVEYVAVEKLAGRENNVSILCLVGPPGVGKTSVAQSIAHALGRDFVRISLGGVEDETEIRGSRRTYVGSNPGRIITGMSQIESDNPLILLDELDKLVHSYRGNPAAALLEVLDPNQNRYFRDAYLEIPYDLSKSLFIATANSLETIPAPLLDRIEVIRMESYTEEEKREIALRYLVPKQLKANGMSDKGIEFEQEAISKIIAQYTREAGVRELERQIGKICRKLAAKEVGGEAYESSVTADAVSRLLGIAKYEIDDSLAARGEIGAVNGLAWTSAGGMLMPIEVSVLTGGKGDIVLTGSLGDVLKESARIALSLIKAMGDRLQIPSDYFSVHDVHIHIPEGGIPKDGPSAGIALATAVLSAVTRKSVDASLAMTGELTLRGKVLAIGGLKEKLLAALRGGIKRVVIPAQNRKDIENLPDSVKKGLEIRTVETVSEVFRVACEVCV